MVEYDIVKGGNMKRIKYFIIALFLVLLVVPVSASNEDFDFKTDDNINLSKEILGSSFTAGNNIDLNSDIEGIGFSFGDNININSQLEYLITAGNNINVRGTVTKDVIIAGNVINLYEDSNIGRDVIIGANEVNIYGKIGRNVKIYASTINFKNTKIAGKVELNATNINIDKNTIINGTLKHNTDAKVDNQSDHIGKITTYENENHKITFADQILNKAISYTSMLMIFLVLALLAPKVFEKLNNQLNSFEATTPFKWFVLGFFSLILAPFIVLLLFSSVIGVYLGILLLVLFIIAICLVNIFISYIIGRLVLQKLLKKDDNILISGFIGMIILYIISLIPYINTIVAFISLFVGLGIILSLLKPKKQN